MNPQPFPYPKERRVACYNAHEGCQHTRLAATEDPHFRYLCPSCLAGGSPSHRRGDSEETGYTRCKAVHLESRAMFEVAVFKRGDPGFEEREAEILGARMFR